MAESSYFWNGTTTGDASLAPYDGPTAFAKFALEAAGMGALTNISGVLLSELNQLVPTMSSANCVIDTGRAFVDGTFYESTSTTSFAIPTPAASTRVDLIVLRKSWGAQTVRLTRVAGVEGGGAPALTQILGTTWDSPIAQCSVTTGGVITLTDTRVYVAPKTYALLGAPTVYDTNSGSPFTYNTPNAATALRIICIGAGGGGEGITTGGSPATVSGAGGGGGGVSESFITNPAATYTIAIGAGGAGHAGAGAGTDGNDTTVNTTLIVAKGGKGGAAQVGGAGGLASGGTGDIKMNGEPGGSVAGNSGVVALPSGKGGSAPGAYGGGGGASVNGSGGPGVTGLAGGPGGGGGSGASAANATTSATGGAGHDGRVVIFAYH